MAARPAGCYIGGMEARPSRLMTVDEFLSWAEAQEGGRYELEDGQIVTLRPEPHRASRSEVRNGHRAA